MSMEQMNSTFRPGDEWAIRVLKINGELCLTDWSKLRDLGSDFFPDSPEIEVTKLLPDGNSIWLGVLGVEGIFDVKDDFDFINVIEIAGWQDIELLPEWEQKK